MKNINPVQITREKKTKIEPFETGETITLCVEETELFNSLANLLEYPAKDWFKHFEKCKELIFLRDSTQTDHFGEFCLDIRKFSLLELQEIYTRTFDLNPVCALEIGYHLFGEDYKRGEFLARLRETENPYELGQDFQLPDYLPVVLRLLGQMEDSQLRANLVGYCLIPALEKMNQTFRKKENTYRNLFTFLLETLKEVATKSVLNTEKAEGTRYQYA